MNKLKTARTDIIKADSILTKLINSRESGLLLLLVLLGVVLSFSTDTFFTSTNMFNLLKQVSMTCMVAAGQTFVITSGGIDLSVGWILTLTSIIMSWLLQAGVSPVIAVPLGILIGVISGAANGFMITRLRLPPFIVTFGMASITRGIVLVITKGLVIIVKDPFVTALGQGYFFEVVPIMGVVMVFVVAAAIFILNKTVFGNHVKAIGGNEIAATLSGINVKRTKVMVYTLAGLFCGIAGVIMSGRLGAGNPNAGTNFDMDSIGATIVGGTSLSGGSGTVVGTLLGAVLLGTIRNGLVLMKVSMYWQTIVTGAIVITVCAIDSLTKSRKTTN